ncbi:hypothetical protein V6615_09260 [Oscillospiraceae bacterium PP1C4]
MKRAFSLFLVFACIATLVACTKKTNRLADLDYDSINKIQIISSMGNPAFGADSKIITDEEEIKQFVTSFNSGIIGKKISSDDIAIGFSSRYIFSNNDKIIAEYCFNVNNTKIVEIGNDYYFVEYGDEDSPYKLYVNSPSSEIVVDIDGKEMDLIRYNENTYVKSELPKETVEWLQYYNSLTEDEKMAISFSPDLGEPFDSNK